jgi:hypothetical protein
MGKFRTNETVGLVSLGAILGHVDKTLNEHIERFSKNIKVNKLSPLIIDKNKNS